MYTEHSCNAFCDSCFTGEAVSDFISHCNSAEMQLDLSAFVILLAISYLHEYSNLWQIVRYTIPCLFCSFLSIPSGPEAVRLLI